MGVPVDLNSNRYLVGTGVEAADKRRELHRLEQLLGRLERERSLMGRVVPQSDIDRIPLDNNEWPFYSRGEFVLHTHLLVPVVELFRGRAAPDVFITDVNIRMKVPECSDLGIAIQPLLFGGVEPFGPSYYSVDNLREECSIVKPEILTLDDFNGFAERLAAVKLGAVPVSQSDSRSSGGCLTLTSSFEVNRRCRVPTKIDFHDQYPERNVYFVMYFYSKSGGKVKFDGQNGSVSNIEMEVLYERYVRDQYD